MRHLAGGERAVGERRVDDDVVVALLERLQPAAAHAEAPLLRPSTRCGTGRGRDRSVREHVRAQLLEAEHGVDRACCSRGRAACESAKSTTRSPSGPSIQPPRIVHSRGTTQSKTCVAGRRLDDLERDLAREHARASRGRRRPVRLRGIGKSSRMSSRSSSPTASPAGVRYPSRSASRRNGLRKIVARTIRRPLTVVPDRVGAD